MSSLYTVTPPLEESSGPGEQANLKVRLQRAERSNKVRSLLLVMPLLAFIVVFFLLPIGDILVRSVQNPALSTYMPKTAAYLKEWDNKNLPDERVFAALGSEMSTLAAQQELDRVGSDLNRVQSGLKSLFSKTARVLSKSQPASGQYKHVLIGIDGRWAKLETWAQLKSMAPAYSGIHYLAALDLQYDEQGNIVRQSESRRIYVDVLIKTFVMTFGITLLCMVLGYPLAYMLACLLYTSRCV